MPTLVSYSQASEAQRQLAEEYVRWQLRAHFPGLRSATWTAALTLFQPDLWLTGAHVSITHEDLTQLTQYLARAAELPCLHPPVYGEHALVLAQQHLQLAELAVWVLAELEAASGSCGPRLHRLLRNLLQGNRLAEEVVQATRWGRDGGRPLPLGLPGGNPAPGSAAVGQRLLALGPAGCRATG